MTKTESGELGSAVSAYIERIQSDRSIVPSFNTFYEYMRDDYRKELAQRDIKVEKSDLNIDNMLTTMRPVSYTHLDVYKRQRCLSFVHLLSSF